ncbi:hypothetical protein ACIFOT_09980 [Neobacillus sp. NRS-1170]
MNSFDYLKIIEELGRLLKDYYDCSDTKIREEIYEEIQRLGKVIAV